MNFQIHISWHCPGTRVLLRFGFSPSHPSLVRACIHASTSNGISPSLQPNIDPFTRSPRTASRRAMSCSIYKLSLQFPSYGISPSHHRLARKKNTATGSSTGPSLWGAIRTNVCLNDLLFISEAQNLRLFGKGRFSPVLGPRTPFEAAEGDRCHWEGGGLQ